MITTDRAYDPYQDEEYLKLLERQAIEYWTTPEDETDESEIGLGPLTGAGLHPIEQD